METSKAISAVFFLFFVQTGFGQTELKLLHGKIVLSSKPVEGVNVINNNSQISTISDSQGDFSISVKENEILVFSAVNLNPLKRRITKDDLRSSELLIEMTIKELELQEVIVDENTAITAENLGIIPKGQKKYSQAERQLATAGDFKPIMLLGLLGGSMQLDPLINKINGRTKRLKANVEIEKKEKNLLKLGYLFDDVYFVQKLQIAKENVNEFKLFVIENNEFCTVLNSKNKTSTEFLLGELAVKYKEIISSENK
ncbi:carboxypeptidase-like regulatory domain-containing protein [Flavobacterium sp. YJ01]|uniref:carboxypeptidase-like regulatory domain-containing protein n=1 Tax=unclassified Flavobacterium TaxID=196869 RepID=UPI0023E37E64|nr:carboxypeptidase-like regulatory domain-containing protein [Flavobacterium sp. YJ01]WET04454.1 carboxypeptidase-like regulatory domain-containing protein [Flavobacterium sp. YJ01]